MENKTDDTFTANVYLITMGRISDNWSVATNDGVVHADDPSTLGEGTNKVTRITRIDYLGEHSDKGRDLIIDGKITHFEDPLINPGKVSAKTLTDIKPWELDGVARIIEVFEANYRLDRERWTFSVGNCGEVRIDDSTRGPQSLVVHVAPFLEVVCTIDLAADYGVAIAGHEGSDDLEFGGVCWAPIESQLDGRLAEAAEYANNFSGSVGLYLSLVDDWRSLDVPSIKKAWQSAVAGLGKDSYFANHTFAARIAWSILGDKDLAHALLKDTLRYAEEGRLKYVPAVMAVVSSLADPGFAPKDENREDIYRLLNEAVKRANTSDEDDLIEIVRTIGGKYGGAHYGDKVFAQFAIDTISGTIGDSKLRSKVRKKAEKLLKDLD